MQVVAAAAMEPPSGHGLDSLREAQVGLLRSVRTADPAGYVRGQVDGYLDVDGVAEDSTTETFIALRLYIDNWRWSGVPFYIRAGKKLPTTQTELRVIFREPPPFTLGSGSEPARRPARDEFVVKLDPSTGARLIVDAQRGDAAEPQPVTLDVEFAEEGGEGATPYEVLLHAAMTGDASRFKRQDAVEECWRIMQPLVDNPPPVHSYAPGTWGPDAANTLVADHGGWQGPWIVDPAT
jgi:glucose-6-phosphate 1-dehydrogenase